MAAAADTATVSKPASTLSSEMQAKIAANRAKALERRRLKAGAAAGPNASSTSEPDDMPTPEEEAEMMAAVSVPQSTEGKQAPSSASASSLPPDDELDALMAEEEALGDLCVWMSPLFLDRNTLAGSCLF